MLTIIILSILNTTIYSNYSNQFIGFLENNSLSNIYNIFATMQFLSIIIILLKESKKYIQAILKKIMRVK